MHRISKEPESRQGEKRKRKLVKTRESPLTTSLATEAQPQLQTKSEIQVCNYHYCRNIQVSVSVMAIKIICSVYLFVVLLFRLVREW